MAATDISGPLRRLATDRLTESEAKDIARYERVRSELSACDDKIGDVFEAGGTGTVSTVASEAATASLWPKKALLLYRLVRKLRPSNLVEFGSALGLSGSCVAVALNSNDWGRFVTRLRDRRRKAVAERSIASIDSSGRTTVRCAMFDEVLDVLSAADFFFLDGNHYLEPTIRYVHAALERMARPATLVLDDVRWSPEMIEAWTDLSHSQSFVASGEALELGVLLTDRVAPPLTPTRSDRLKKTVRRIVR